MYICIHVSTHPYISTYIYLYLYTCMYDSRHIHLPATIYIYTATKPALLT